jgi:hypothetical protein
LLDVVALAALLAACSGIAQRVKDQQLQQQVLQYAEAQSITSRTLAGTTVGARSATVNWSCGQTSTRRICEPYINLQFTNRIGLSSTAGTVSNRLDSVLVDRDRCQISEIRPTDYKRMRSDLRKDKQ